MATSKQPLSLKGRALALLAQREHSEVELRRKLLRHARAEAAAKAVQAGAGASAEQDGAAEDDMARVDAVIDWLRTHNYLSEQRFVESRMHARTARYGNLRIRQELAQHGLSLPADAAQALKDSEADRAAAVWERKFGRPAADAAGRARQARFLAQRGFSPEVISRVLRQAGRAPAEPAEPESD
ncbi:Regulatory protein RecX [Burkholderiaceae bacterium]|nr:Regulatory protein RecX [Burkholderiaceae bacterium]